MYHVAVQRAGSPGVDASLPLLDEVDAEVGAVGFRKGDGMGTGQDALVLVDAVV